MKKKQTIQSGILDHMIRLALIMFLHLTKYLTETQNKRFKRECLTLQAAYFFRGTELNQV